MSFLRHQETHQSDDLECERARRNRHALAHRVMSLRGSSWGVALHDPAPLTTVGVCNNGGRFSEAIAAIRDHTLTCGLTWGRTPKAQTTLTRGYGGSPARGLVGKHPEPTLTSGYAEAEAPVLVG